MGLSVFVSSFLFGIVVEWFAHKNSLWMYQRTEYLLFNIFFVFTVVQGGVAFLCIYGVNDISIFRVLLFSIVGSAIGILYEICNEYGLRLFDFGSGFVYLCGKKQLILGVGIAWGGVPFLSSLVYLWLASQQIGDPTSFGCV